MLTIIILLIAWIIVHNLRRWTERKWLGYGSAKKNTSDKRYEQR